MLIIFFDGKGIVLPHGDAGNIIVIMVKNNTDK